MPEILRLQAIVEALIYAAPEPVTLRQLSRALNEPEDQIAAAIEAAIAEHEKPEHGLTIRRIAGGYQMVTKSEHHQQLRQALRDLRPPIPLSMPALETLAIIAYKQPISAPEIQKIRRVEGSGVLDTLLRRKLIAPAGREKGRGAALRYKTTHLFLLDFGLQDLEELPSLREFKPTLQT